MENNFKEDEYSQTRYDEELAIKYPQKQLTCGDVRRDITNTQEILKPLANLKKVSPDVIYFYGQIECLNENYTQIKKLYSSLK